LIGNVRPVATSTPFWNQYTISMEFVPKRFPFKLNILTILQSMQNHKNIIFVILKSLMLKIRISKTRAIQDAFM